MERQSRPSDAQLDQLGVHPPLTRGSRTSRLLSEKLDKGHAKGLTDAELRLFACWIDLGIPFCGDYEEANLWNDADRARWKTCVEKRRRDCCGAELPRR